VCVRASTHTSAAQVTVGQGRVVCVCLGGGHQFGPAPPLPWLISDALPPLVHSRRPPPPPPAQGGWTPLKSASKNGHVEVVKVLLDRGADKEAKTTVVMMAHTDTRACAHTRRDTRDRRGRGRAHAVHGAVRMNISRQPPRRGSGSGLLPLPPPLLALRPCPTPSPAVLPASAQPSRRRTHSRRTGRRRDPKCVCECARMRVPKCMCKSASQLGAKAG